MNDDIQAEWDAVHEVIEAGEGPSLKPDYSQLDALDAEVHGIINQADECINAVIREADGTVSELQDLADGCWRSVVGRGEELIAKLSDKAVNYAIARLSEAYTHALHFGITSADIERILGGYGDPIQPPNGGGTTNGGTTDGGGVPSFCPDPLAFLCIDPLTDQSICIPPCIRDVDGTIYNPEKCQDTITGVWIDLPDGEWVYRCMTQLTCVDVGGTLTTEPPEGTYPPPIGILGSGNPYGLPPGAVINTTRPPAPTPTPTPTPYPTPQPPPVPPLPPGGTISTTPYTNPQPGQPCAPLYCYPYGYPPTLTGEKPLPVMPVSPDEDKELPLTEFGRKPETPPAIVPEPAGPPSDFCGIVSTACAIYIKIGAALRENRPLQFDHLVQLGAFTGAIPTALVNALVDAAAAAFTAFFGGHIIAPYIQTLQLIGVCDTERHMSLIVCRQFFAFIESAIIKVEAGVKGEASAKIGVPELVKLLKGLDAEAHAGVDGTLGAAGELRPFFVPLKELLEYCIRWSCPVEIPSIPDSIESFLKGRIGEQHLRCLIEMKGGRYDEWSNVLEARREQLNTDEIIRLWLRDKLTDKEVDTRLRNAGMLFESEREEKRILSQEIPPVTDVVRFMVRDVEDPDVVKDFQLDDAYEKKFQGTLKDYAKAQGIPDEAMKRYWRAHWRTPSDGQVLEMFQRLRPEKPQYANSPLKVTITDVREVLGYNDLLNTWRDRLVEIAYNPLTRIDSRRAYIGGQMSRDQFVSAARDIGYDPVNAEILATFADGERRKKIEASKYITAYVKGGLNRLQVKSHLGAQGYQEGEITDALATADDAMEIDARERCVSGWVKRYTGGEIDELELMQGLTALGLDALQVDHMIRRECKVKGSKERHETASTLCDWYSHGLITADDFSTRLVNIGYNSVDAMNVIRRCNIKIADALKKEEEKALKEAEKKEKQLEKLVADEKKRHDALIRLANRVAKVNDTSGELEASNVNVALERLQAERGLSLTDAYRVALATAERIESKGPVDIIDMIMSSGAAFPEVPLPA